MADGNGYLGARLRVTTEEGKYEGTVHSIDARERKLTLNKVVCCNTGRKLHGFHHFLGSELNNLELLHEVNNNGKSKTANSEEVVNNRESDKREHNSVDDNVQPSKPLHPSRPTKKKSSVGFGKGNHGGVVKAFAEAGIGFNAKLPVSSGSIARDVSDEGNSLLKRDPIVAEKYLADTLSDDDDKENLSPDVLPDVVTIDAFGESFQDAVKFISRQRVIGVCCEGINLGRYGKLCWLVVGCSKVIYLFDIHTLGAACFDEGLQDILESGDILKVFHDCRQASDALYHVYNITLMNVFDTQVADVIIYRNEREGSLPRHVNGLVACLYEYLNLSPELVNFQKIRQKYMKESESIWAERPAPASLIQAAAKHVMYLRELRLAQMERLMAEFIYGVDIYLSAFRDAKKLNFKAKGQLLPEKFKELGGFRYRQRTRRYDGDFAENTSNGVPEDVLASREVWSEGQHFTDAYERKQGRVKERKFGAPNPVDRLRQAARESGSDSEASNCSSTSNGAAAVGPVESSSATNKSCPVAVPAHIQTMFSDKDFPPLSGSESEEHGTPPRSSFRAKSRVKGAKSVGRFEPSLTSNSGLVSSSPEVERSPQERPVGVSREFAPLPGRGRAQTLLRHAGMPALRLPTEDAALSDHGNGSRDNMHEFPSDEEILAAPEVIPVPREQISGGTQVRIRRM